MITLLGVALIGIGIGATLQTARFGFAAAFRSLITRGEAGAVGAQFLSISLASALMIPLIANGYGAGIETPIGPSFLIGGFLFGIGMQLAGGCASGTLYLLGGGNLKFGIALAGFVAGSAIGAAHMGFWWSLPALPAIAVPSLAKWPLALGLQVALLLGSGLWLVRRFAPSRGLVLGGLVLALLNVATLLVAGRAWTETFGFALWGSKLAALIGFQPRDWAFWQVFGPDTLDRSIFGDITSIMDMSIIGGALLAAGLGRDFRLKWPSLGDAFIASCAGILMGYGARLSDGCNIGAYFSAAATGSLSGFVWLLPALAGSAMGVHLRQTLEGKPRHCRFAAPLND